MEAHGLRHLGACLLAVVLVGPGAFEVRAETALYRAIDERLELMDEVASYKWHNGLPVEDTGRERVVLDRAVADALRHGFTPGSSRAFFAAQIEAAKVIQRYWFRQWRAGGEPGAGPDLERVLRPELLRLGEVILDTAVAAGPGSPRPADFAASVSVEGLDDDTRTGIHEALAGLERFPDRLTQILETGVLRVGTTGDYEPFSYRREPESEPSGIDIDLARDLAAALGVEPVFVATTWPALMADLRAGRYDIAMSGVSRVLERQRHGYLSAGYYAGGKTPIARCEARDELDSLAAIDRPGVRVIVNPGGTNERFVDTRIHRAGRILHLDNRTIFEALAAGEADVMITDRVEVELQASRHPELCATMSKPFTYQEKAYLMPRDEAWRAFVDTWLSLALADGTVAAVFREHGVEARPPGAAGRTRAP